MENRAYGAVIVASKFGWPVTYDVAVQIQDSAQTIVRRYSDFLRLRDSLGSRAEGLPPLPPKAGPSMLSTSFRDQRRIALDEFLLAVVAAFPALESDELADFLGVSEAERQAIQAAACTTVPTEPTVPTGPGANSLRNMEMSVLASSDSPHETSCAPRPADQVEPPAQPTDVDSIRELRRRRWLEQQGDSASQQVPQNSGDQGHAASSSSTAAASSGGALEPLVRIQLQPLRELPQQYNDPTDRLELLRPALTQLRGQGMVVEVGAVLEGRGESFAVTKCTPSKGILGADTRIFTDGPPLIHLRRVQFLLLPTQADSGANETKLLSDYVIPHFRNVSSAAPGRLAVVSQGDTIEMGGSTFYVFATDPEAAAGIIDNNTTFFANTDDCSEFDRIHIVPFSDTLPSAYQFDIFNDYARPYFQSHTLERFEVGQTFYHNGVQFSVVFAEPQGPCRVGRRTMIHTEGTLHPTVQNLLRPDLARRLAAFPPGLQMMLLQTDMFGDGEVSDRIMQAQERHMQVQRANLTSSFRERVTQEEVWSQELRARTPLDQTDCMVCLCSFEEGESVRLLPCNHIFHTGCVDEWLGRDAHCPICRHSLRAGRLRSQGSRR